MEQVIKNLTARLTRRPQSIWRLNARITAGLSLVSLGLSVPIGLMAQTTAQIGEWETLPYEMPINPIRVGLLHTGKVLIVAGSENWQDNNRAGISRAALWDPQGGTITVQNNLPWDLFCNGMAFLPDGRALIVGGTEQYSKLFQGDARAGIFDPITEQFIQVESLAHGRWYATATALNDGRILVFSGRKETTGEINQAVEIYQVAWGWSPEYLAPWKPNLYPWTHLLPNGQLFYSGPTRLSYFFNPVTQSWKKRATINFGRTRSYGSSVLLPLLPEKNYAPRVMILGGGRNPATATTEIIDLSQTTPKWRETPKMSKPRTTLNAVLLPNGEVLALGGSAVYQKPSTASLAADLFNPQTETMAPAGSTAYARLYHSVALLLPDATVMVAGNDPPGVTYDKHIEIYSPPYLYTIDASGQAIPAVRPEISDAPKTIGYAQAFPVKTPDAPNIKSVVLMRPGSPTHAFDMEQRMIGLSYNVVDEEFPGTLMVMGPPNSNIAPPGYYMVFILTDKGVPSIARFVQLSPTPENHPPKGMIMKPETNQTIQGGQAVTFEGTASDPDDSADNPNASVSRYSWIFPGGVPSESTAKDPGSITFPKPGTYVVSLTVVDNLGANDPSPPTRTVVVRDSGNPY
jgi:PKD domain./Domain of unknown function (DUF1929)./Glyoxal oxidase N-terminus.